MGFYSKFYAATIALILSGTAAHAIDYSAGKFDFKLTGYGTGGIIQPDFETPLFIGDWRVRGEIDLNANDNHKFGAVYSLDAAATDDGKAFREAFGFYQLKQVGRIEIGFTDSIARKLGVGLPDVGGLRINDRPIFHKKIVPEGPVISDTTLTTGRSALRVNIATSQINGAQYGLSLSGITDDYDYAVDGGLKIRKSDGKVKRAFSLGASFMNNPHAFSTDVYAPPVTADSRTQLTAGMNIQYNSWIWGNRWRIYICTKCVWVIHKRCAQ